MFRRLSDRSTPQYDCELEAGSDRCSWLQPQVIVLASELLLPFAGQVDLLDRKGFTEVCKEIYMTISGLTEEQSRAFFATKGWVDGSIENSSQGPVFATRKKMAPRPPRA